MKTTDARMVATLLAPIAFATLAHAHDAAGNAHSTTPPQVVFSDCTEFVGVAPVDAVKARALVPTRYNLVSDAAGARLVVRVADCKNVKVGTGTPRAGRVAQIGIIIVSPDGTATDPNTSINNYTLSYASDSPALVFALRAAGEPAALDTALAVETTPATGANSEFYAAAAPEGDISPTWFLQGRVNTPAVGTSFLANWWRLGSSRQTKMATSIAAINFDFASVVSFSTSRLNTVGRLLGRNTISAFPVSFHGAFATGTMVTTVTALTP